MTQPPVLLTVLKTVERLAQAGIDVSPETVRHWARSGKVAHVTLPGGRYFFRAEDIEALLKPSGRAA